MQSEATVFLSRCSSMEKQVLYDTPGRGEGKLEMKLNPSDLQWTGNSGRREPIYLMATRPWNAIPLSFLFPALPRSSALIPPIDLRRRRKKAKSASAAAEAFSHAAKGREGVSE